MFKMSLEQQQMLSMVAGFAAEKIWPNALSWDEKAYFPKEILKEAAQLGLAGLFAQADIGGSGLSRTDGVLIFSELAYACPSTSAFLSIHNMVLGLVDAYAKPKIREYWGPKLVQMEAIGSYCLTEPNSGSDAASLKTTAKDMGDYYLVNGSKAFISGAGESDIYVTMVRTGDQSYQGISSLLIPKDTPGLRFGKKEEKMGWRNQPTAMVYFENCEVPKDHLLGELGMGFRYALKALNGGRLNIAACSLGGAKRALQLSKNYMNEREQFGKKLSSMQALRFDFANMLIKYEASRQILMQAAAQLDEGDIKAPRACAMAKKFVTEESSKIVNQALQLYGGYGYLKDYHVEKIYRDLRVHEILEGTNQIMCEIIAKSIFEDEVDWD
jgi:butyryl-CoA dehydrogenase